MSESQTSDWVHCIHSPLPPVRSKALLWLRLETGTGAEFIPDPLPCCLQGHFPNIGMDREIHLELGINFEAA